MRRALISLLLVLCAAPVFARGESDAAFIGRIGVLFVFDESIAHGWPNLQAAVESRARSVLAQHSFELLSPDEAKRLLDPVLEISLTIGDVAGCPSIGVAQLRIALVRYVYRESSATAGYSLREQSAMVLWRTDLVFGVDRRNPAQRIDLHLLVYLDEFAMDFASAREKVRVLSALNKWPPPQENSEPDEAENAHRIGVALKVQSSMDDASFLSVGSDHRWSRLQARLETRVGRTLRRGGFTVVESSEATGAYDPILTVYVRLLEFEACRRTVFARMQLVFAAPNDLERPIEQALSERKAVPVWENATDFTARRARVVYRAEEELGQSLRDFLNQVSW